MNPIFSRTFCTAVFSLGASLLAGEPVTPTPPAPPVVVPVNPPARPGAEKDKPPLPVPAPKPVTPQSELVTLLTELLNGDAARRDAAGKGLVGKGAAAWRSLAPYVNHTDADIAKRAKDIRKQIEDKSMQLFQDASTLQGKVLGGALTVAGLDEVRKAWGVVASFAPQNEFRQNATQSVQALQGKMAQVEEAIKLLKDKDAELTAAPAPNPLARAAIHTARAQALAGLQRYDEAFKAAADAFEAGGKDSRLAPGALRMQAELLSVKQENAPLETICKKILADYPDSLEARYALSTLVDVYMELKRWDEAIDAVKNFYKACPLEEDAQTAVDNLLDTLMEKQRDYPRAYGFSTWIKTSLHRSRVRPEVLKVLACVSEYPLKDYAAAETAYKILAAEYADVISAAEVDGVLKRVKDRKEDKFPKEPKPTDEGPAGALAQFLTAVRKRDVAQLKAVVPAAEGDEYAAKLTGDDTEIIHTITFGDFIVKKVDLDGDKAVIGIDYYNTTTYKPIAITQKAHKENGAWKITWMEPDEQLNPPAAPQIPKPK